MPLTYYTGFGYGLTIFTSFSLLVIFYLFSYKWRSHGHLLFSIDDKKLTEVCATLAGIVGFICLGTSVLLVVYVVEGEIEHVISLEVSNERGFEDIFEDDNLLAPTTCSYNLLLRLTH